MVARSGRVGLHCQDSVAPWRSQRGPLPSIVDFMHCVERVHERRSVNVNEVNLFLTCIEIQLRWYG